MSEGVCKKKFHFDVWPNANPDKKFIPYPQREVLASWNENQIRNMAEEGVHLKTCQALEWKGFIEPVRNSKDDIYRLTAKGLEKAREIRGERPSRL